MLFFNFTALAKLPKAQKLSIVTTTWVGLAHCPAVGTKLYVPPIVLLITAGVQVPLIPFGEMFSKAGALAPLQTVKVVAKSGVIIGFTVNSIVSVIVHNPL